MSENVEVVEVREVPCPWGSLREHDYSAARHHKEDHPEGTPKCRFVRRDPRARPQALITPLSLIYWLVRREMERQG